MTDPNTPATPPAAPPTAQGARCANHNDRLAVAACVRCGTFICNECARPGEKSQPMCAQCEPYNGPSIPWEQRKEIGLGRALAQTLKLAALSPSEFYKIPPREPNMTGGLLFGFIFAFAIAVISTVFNLTLGSARLEEQIAQMRAAGGSTLPAQFNQWMSWYIKGVSAYAVFAAPASYLMGLFMTAGVTWLGLKLTSNLRSSFSRIVIALAYTQWVQLLAVLALNNNPILAGLGSFVMFAAYAVYWTILVQQTQRISLLSAIWTSVVIVAISFMICCLCCGLPVFAGVMIFAQQLSKTMH